MSGSRTAGRWLALGAASGALLVWGNVVVPALPADPGLRTAANLGGTLALGALAASSGLSRAELGLGRASWRAGARWGGAAFAAVAAGYAAALALPGARTALAGQPVEATSDLLVRALVLIPMGTVLCEEVAFRGVLLALARRVLPSRRALAFQAAVFGLWHVGSALPVAGPASFPVPREASVAGVVVVTTLGGLLLGWLRHRSGSLVAPIGLHLGTNSIGLLAAAAARATEP